MSEFIFVLKCLFVTVLVVFSLQLKVSGVSIETHLERVARSSNLVSYFQTAANGGAALLQDGYLITKQFVLDSTASLRGESRTIRSER
ncbi:MAG: hypothetical protein ACK5Y2_06795 [Bdellovibrionales bacterium]